MANKAVYERAYKLIDKVTPLSVDCGRLCGSRCCTEYEPGVGMYLLPGEEAMYQGDEDWFKFEIHSSEEYDFCPEWKGNFYFMVCKGTCPRDKRPFACRTFPLVPHLEVSGEMTMIFDVDGALICPLVQLGKLTALHRPFIKACKEAWMILMEDDPLIYADVHYESEKRRSGVNNVLFSLLGRGKDGTQA